jgi:hypothetical protein
MTGIDWRKRYAAAAAAGRNHAAENRELVLGYDDLAARLTRPPIGYATAQAWSGYIAPAMTPARSDYERNLTGRRVQLVALVREAIERKHGPEAARQWLEDVNADRWTPSRSTSVYDAMHRAADVLDRNTPAWAKEGT